MNKIFTGIGSRDIPKEIEFKIKSLSKTLYESGFILRSGGANGADLAWESQFYDNKEIYLPWQHFNQNNSALYNISNEALELAAKHHPNWSKLGRAAKLLHARNCYQVLGKDLLIPSDFVICWTPDGCESYKTRSSLTGGTGTAIEIASKRNIPIINMFNSNWYENLKLTLEEI